MAMLNNQRVYIISEPYTYQNSHHYHVSDIMGSRDPWTIATESAGESYFYRSKSYKYIMKIDP